jgi:hypothetical protein
MCAPSGAKYATTTMPSSDSKSQIERCGGPSLGHWAARRDSNICDWVFSRALENFRSFTDSLMLPAFEPRHAARMWQLAVSEPQPPKLLDQVRRAIGARYLSPRTEEAYVHWIRRYIVHHGKRHPRELGAAEVTPFLTDLAVRQRVSASTSNQGPERPAVSLSARRRQGSRQAGRSPAGASARPSVGRTDEGRSTAGAGPAIGRCVARRRAPVWCGPPGSPSVSSCG